MERPAQETHLRFAAADLREALEAMTAAAQAVIANWSRGDLAAAVRALDGTIAGANAALTKAKGGNP